MNHYCYVCGEPVDNDFSDCDDCESDAASLCMARQAALDAGRAYVDKMGEAREAGMTWQVIADACGFNSRQAAHDWYKRNQTPS